MIKKSEKFIVLCFIIISFLIGRIFIFSGNSITNYTYIFNPIFWLLMAVLSYFITKDSSKGRQSSKYDINQTVVIIIIIYTMVYFSLGLIVGYEKSPYSHEIVSVLKNLWAFVFVIFVQEITRFNLIKASNKKISNYMFISLLFVISEISFWNFTGNFANNVDTFKYISETIIPLIVTNMLFTYLSVNSGSLSSIIYRSVMALLLYLLPIYPSLNWLLKTMIDIILVIITALYVNYVEMKSNRIISRREIKKEKISSYIPFFLILVVSVCFISGTFKYQPIAVLSDSMYPKFKRGDSVIIEKINDNSLKKIKKGTIIYYSKENSLIIHRVHEIKKDEKDNIIYITKGDNNNAPDSWEVKENDIIGTVKFMIPYIGYPSVLVNEFLKK